MMFDANRHEQFFSDLAKDGFHVFSRRNAKIAGFYPNAFPSFPEIDIANIGEGDTVKIRVFFSTNKATPSRIDSGHMDLVVEHEDRNTQTIFGNIVTKLPPEFALAEGTTIELSLDEVLSVRR
jgi:hypothetical protein